MIRREKKMPIVIRKGKKVHLPYGKKRGKKTVVVRKKKK